MPMVFLLSSQSSVRLIVTAKIPLLLELPALYEILEKQDLLEPAARAERNRTLLILNLEQTSLAMRQRIMQAMRKSVPQMSQALHARCI